jgi:hypothetical protein
MRIRQITPAFWTDAVIAGLPVETRLVYIGLWQVADDAGWFRESIPEIALSLLGYEPRARRERMIRSALESLAAAGRVVRHDCGHSHIPTMERYQRVGGKRSYWVRSEHATRCGAGPVREDLDRSGTSREVTKSPHSNVTELVTERNGTEHIGGPRQKTSEFRARMAALGVAPEDEP